MNDDKYLFFIGCCNVYLEQGWYFADEAEQANGPYNSKDEAREAFKEYVKYL